MWSRRTPKEREIRATPLGCTLPLKRSSSSLSLSTASAIKTFAPVLLVICGLGFYFGGMAGAYKAPGRHRLHGTLVAPVAFLISPVMNLLLGMTPFPGLDSV